MTDTHPNPALAIEGKKGKFRPAWDLTDEGMERLGRDR
jgi:FAD synthetase